MFHPVRVKVRCTAEPTEIQPESVSPRRCSQFSTEFTNFKISLGSAKYSLYMRRFRLPGQRVWARAVCSQEHPPPPRTPCTFLFFPCFFVCLVPFSGLLGGIQARLVNARPNTPPLAWQKEKKRNRKRKESEKRSRQSTFCAAALWPTRKRSLF